MRAISLRDDDAVVKVRGPNIFERMSAALPRNEAGEIVVKIEANLNDNAFWVAIWVPLFICATIVGLALVYYHTNSTNKFVQGGYCSTDSYTRDGGSWVRCDLLKK